MRLYLQKQKDFLNEGWNFLFTDGSKGVNCSTSYAVVGSNGEYLSLRILPHFTSIFVAEASAIFNAAHIAVENQSKTVICSDSLSVIKAVRNPMLSKWNIINQIRDLLIKHHSILKIFWIPGHTNIEGNICADEAAKFASTAPIIMEYKPEKVDIRNLINEHIRENQLNEWSGYYHPHYKDINVDFIPPKYPTNVSKCQIRNFSRLRLGHTFATHSHILRNESAPTCRKCNMTLTMDHILIDCVYLRSLRRSIFGSDSPKDLLKKPEEENIRRMFDFVRQLGIII